MNISIPVIFRRREFMHLWTSQLFSQFAINLLLFLVLVHIFERTGSSIATSFVWVAYSLPAMIVGPFAAASVDVWDRRKILMVANLVQGLTLFSFGVFFDRSIYLSYWAVFFYSFFNQFYVPAESSVLPDVVKKKEYPDANGVFFLTQQFGLVAGFALGGILNELLGIRNTVFFSSVFLLFAFFSVSLLPSMKVKVDVSTGMEKGVGAFFRSMVEGYNFIKNHRYIMLPFLLLMSLQVSLSVIGANLPALATEIIRVPANSSSFLVVLPAGLGAGIGTFLASKLLRKGFRKRRIIEAALLLLAFEVWSVVFIIPMLLGDIRIIVAVALFLATGASFASVIVPSQTFLQESTPGGMRGRVFGNFWLLGVIATLVPVIFSATITEIFGSRFMFFLLGLGALMGYLTAIHHGKGRYATE